MAKNEKAVVLLSGGLDSTTTLALANSKKFQVYALTFKYGQRHDHEIKAAQKIAQTLGVVEHKIASLDLRLFGGSALTDQIEVPKDSYQTDTIPITYVPARNTIFLSYALAWCEVLEATHVFIGVNSIDYSGYPDCRPEFIRAFQEVANLGTKLGVTGKKITIHTPLAQLSKSNIIALGQKLGVDYSITLTCYDPDSRGYACGHCDACILRLRGFSENSMTDPAPYQE